MKGDPAKEEDLRQELKKIYADGDGELPDFTKLEGKPSGRWKPLIFGLFAFLIVLAGVTWAGFFLFIKPSTFTGEGVSVRFETADHLTVGGEAELTVRYANNEKEPLASSSLIMKLPDGFVFESSEPARGEDGSWTIGSIAPGGEGAVKIKGRTLKEVGSMMIFQAELDYKPADFNSDFQKAASQTLAVTDSVLKMTATAPAQMDPGDKIDLTFNYENASDRRLENLKLTLAPLEGFVFESAAPAPDANTQDSWTVASLDPRAKGNVTVSGTFSASSRGTKELVATVGFLDQGRFVASATAGAATEVQKSDISLSQIVNGSDKPPAVSFGDTLHFSVTYKNTGDVKLRDVAIRVELPSEPAAAKLVDWVTLKDGLSGKQTDSLVSWNKKQIPALEALNPGDEGTIDFSVQLTKKPAESSSSTLYAVDSKVVATIGRTGSGATSAKSREVSTDVMRIMFNSDTVFNAYGRYFDDSGVPLGSGPLPPEVGKPTVYRIFWTVQNSLHELDNLDISTVLPEGVRWTGTQRQVDAGALTFDETGRKATWTLNKMPTSAQSITVSFDVELTPLAQDEGTIVDLTGESRFSAYDKETGSVILKTKPPVGTDLLGDTTAGGKGVVSQ